MHKGKEKYRLGKRNILIFGRVGMHRRAKFMLKSALGRAKSRFLPNFAVSFS